jgi:hypothetical protein
VCVAITVAPGRVSPVELETLPLILDVVTWLSVMVLLNRIAENIRKVILSLRKNLSVLLIFVVLVS